MTEYNYSTRVSLKPETHEELAVAIQFFKELEEDFGMDWKENDKRLGNGKFDRDKIIRKALKQMNEKNNVDKEEEIREKFS